MSEEKYRTIFENTGTAMAIIETDTTISMVNDEFARIVGATKQEFEGKVKWTDMVVKEDLPKMAEFHRRRREGGEAPREYEFRFRDGRKQIKTACADHLPHTGDAAEPGLDDGYNRAQRERGKAA